MSTRHIMQAPKDKFNRMPNGRAARRMRSLSFAGHLALIWKHAVAIAIAIVIVFEEWGWEPLSRLVGRLSSLPALAALEHRISTLPPYGALALLLLPWALLLPVKVLTLWLLATGQFALATLAVIGSKLVGTAIVARLFTLTKPALLQLHWFASRYERWLLLKHRWLMQARATNTWALMRLTRIRVRFRIYLPMRRAIHRWRHHPA